MFDSRDAKITRIAEEIGVVREALERGSASELDRAISSLERALIGVSAHGENGDVVEEGRTLLGAARPALPKMRAQEEQQRKAAAEDEVARRMARLKGLVHPCTRCGGADAYVSENATIEVETSRLFCAVTVCASCGDVRMIANLGDLTLQRSFTRVSGSGAAPYR